MNHPYSKSQKGLALLKSAIHDLLRLRGSAGMTNAEIGRSLGIYYGHIGHEGHISRTLLSILEAEGVVEQREDKKWVLVELISS